jgi:hypothetical protein
MAGSEASSSDGDAKPYLNTAKFEYGECARELQCKLLWEVI